MEREEMDLIVLEDDNGNEIEMQVLDYMYYEGKEYALLSPYEEDREEEDVIEVIAMEVRPIEGDEENEEFVPIPDELGMQLLEIFQKNWEEEDDEEDDEEI